MRSFPIALFLVVTACHTGQPQQTAVPRPAPQLEQQAGAILHVEAFAGAPADATASRILYASTSADGAAITVSALVVVPRIEAPAGGRPIVAWLHATTGVDSSCAPSLGPNPFGQIQGLSAFLAAGAVVVATDYPGLGAPGVHPYLIGASEARAALDSVRAVANWPEAQASHRFAVWGHSQGGHAALFTARLAAQYAPELMLVGVAAAAPATDLRALLEQPGADPLWGALLAYTVSSWSRLYGVDPDAIVPAAARATIDRAAQDCLQSSEELDKLLKDAAPLQGTRVVPGESWQKVLEDNAPEPWTSAPPAFFAQGDADPTIVPQLTRNFARRLCDRGTPVRYLELPGVDHYTAAMRSAAEAAGWIADRFAGGSAPDDCADL